jgi:murein L,D-transpeptidase YcbB/YkuD
MITMLRTALLTLFFGTLPFHVRADSPDAASDALRRMTRTLADGQPVVIEGASIASHAVLVMFYERRAYRPAWSGGNAPSELLHAVAEAEDHGLLPEDYHAGVLARLSAAGDRLSADQQAGLDMLRTDALIRLAYHLKFGKVDPRLLDPDWNHREPLLGDDPARAIECTLAGDSVGAVLHRLAPSHPLYRELQRALAHYRALDASGTWPTLTQGPTLREGMTDTLVPALRRRLGVEAGSEAGSGDTGSVYDVALAGSVGRYQQRMGLEADGVLGPSTWRELALSAADRVNQIRVNLERGRWVLNNLDPASIVVNIAGFTLYALRAGEVVWSTRVQVGTTARRTPVFRDTIDHVVFNPTWTVPPTIVARDLLPGLREDPAHASRKGLKVIDSRGRTVDPRTVNWSAVSAAGMPYTFRQDPGPNNALGRVKIMFPNHHMVYLHDTPAQAKFDKADRTFSSGCVRVEQPFDLVELLLDDPVRWSRRAIDSVVAAGVLSTVRLEHRVPVMLLYWTAWVDADGGVAFRRDVYGRDRRVLTSLDEPFAFSPRRVRDPRHFYRRDGD